mmetsp:Transcript_25737/g.70784  ORF Transcript_25737/g.70784 Transcript_25737/m.70784 type:complete len:223 (+) Transcript_25737:69-737(+)|eukprot:CAMPEP_0172371006 /NCGR_PEP_ID=MMETSP1060-20121228/40815_1 /TAXON_ID=37318 /ORGANISM="Pseudo-nitzschia pungens, Strain cf. cingulata" /LENGTH=222 /DNA_ID=CAMNT_0013096495 /DNA_START=137 /DNA_END=805 /DNA_ORIENTATION=+
MKIARRTKCGASSALCVVTLLLSLSTISSFVIKPATRALGITTAVHATDTNNLEEIAPDGIRRDFLRKAPASVLSGIASLNILTLYGLPALASDEVELPTKEAVTKCFEYIRYELNDPEGGVAYMQGRIDKEDFAGLLDFSKGYDLEFRKRRFGNAKKLLQDKEVKAKATEYANAVTFDLIGINRSCRKGQESVESANKYLQELRDDTNKFLALEETIQVKP